MTAQTSILPPPPFRARYLSFSSRPGANAAASRAAVQRLELNEHITVGIGAPLARLWGCDVPGLRPFPALTGPGVEAPSTQNGLWIWLRGTDRGDLVHRAMAVVDALDDQFRLEHSVDGFKFGSDELGKDLTGYEDGTENPTGDEAVEVAFAADGSSFVAVQQWIHDLRDFGAMSQDERDLVIGRRLSDNTEIGDAPESAHVKRTEQESFDPEAKVLRRSMPFSSDAGDGLLFVAFGHTLDHFEVQMRRMIGEEDGITDALFRFSRPVTGGYYWCPPQTGSHLDLD